MLVLASASPRRQELLRNARILFKCQPADVPEVLQDGESPVGFACRLARAKALAVFGALDPPPGTFVLGADTIVVVEDEVLGKPANEEDAFRMLRLLADRSHEVTTGVCLIGREATLPDVLVEDVRVENTTVTFGPLTDAEIEDYIATSEPMDKAGGYAIQGVASRWIPRIEGDYCNVVGLPVALVTCMLRERGAL
jgi:septum formation protein